jgi:hypothetical protein
MRARYPGTWLGGLLGAVVLAAPARADLEFTPRAYVQASPDGSHYVRVTPDEQQVGVIAAYAVVPGGPDRELWRTQGWYSFEVRLADDGHHLVRLADFLRGDGPSESDIAAAFYEDGRLVRSWSTRALVHDDGKVFRTTSHYDYLAGEPVFWSNPQRAALTLTTLDGYEFQFDAKTGKMTSERSLEPPAGEEAEAAETATGPEASSVETSTEAQPAAPKSSTLLPLGLAFLLGATGASIVCLSRNRGRGDSSE